MNDTDASIATTCARCSAPLAIALDGSNASIEAAAHQVRCFVVGDYVRWTSGLDEQAWADCIVRDAGDGDYPTIQIQSHNPYWDGDRFRIVSRQVVSHSILRRIPRPKPDKSGQSLLERWDSYVALDLARRGEVAPDHARPIAVGDLVRWERGSDCHRSGAWIEGEVLAVSEASGDDRTYRIMVARSHGHRVGSQPVVGVLRATITRINPSTIETPWIRVGQFQSAPVTVTKAELDHARDNPIGLYERAAGLPPPERKYDGLTATQCYMKWSDNRATVERGGHPLYALTPAQIEAGRRAYQSDALNEHAAELRAKLAASREVERTRVALDDNDG